MHVFHLQQRIRVSAHIPLKIFLLWIVKNKIIKKKNKTKTSSLHELHLSNCYSIKYAVFKDLRKCGRLSALLLY